MLEGADAPLAECIQYATSIIVRRDEYESRLVDYFCSRNSRHEVHELLRPLLFRGCDVSRSSVLPDSRPWTAEQVATMGRIRDAAMTDSNAYNMSLPRSVSPPAPISAGGALLKRLQNQHVLQISDGILISFSRIPHHYRFALDQLVSCLSANTQKRLDDTREMNSSHR